MSDQADAKSRPPVDNGEEQDTKSQRDENHSPSLPQRSRNDLQSRVYNIRPNAGSLQALIINNLPASNITGEKDTMLMRESLTQSGFSVKCKTRMKIEDLEICLKEEADNMPSGIDCFVCVVIALGGDGFIKGFCQNASQTKTLSREAIYEHFKGNNCKPLVLKPKIFIIMSWDKAPGSRMQADGDTDEAEVFKIPTDSDILVYECHMSGRPEHDYNEDGSWLIQSLSGVIQKNRERSQSEKIDFLRLLTIVNSEMATKQKSSNLTRSECIPLVTSTLTKLIYI